MGLFEFGSSIFLSDEDIFKFIFFLVVAVLYGVGWLISVFKKAAKNQLERQTGNKRVKPERRQVSTEASPHLQQHAAQHLAPPDLRTQAGMSHYQQGSQQQLQTGHTAAHPAPSKPQSPRMQDLMRNLALDIQRQLEEAREQQQPKPQAAVPPMPVATVSSQSRAAQNYARKSEQSPEFKLLAREKPKKNVKKKASSQNTTVERHRARGAQSGGRKGRPNINARDAVIYSVIFSQPRYKQPPGHHFFQ